MNDNIIFPDKLSFCVKKEHVEKGECRKPEKCALTLAVIEAYPQLNEYFWVHVSEDTVSFFPRPNTHPLEGAMYRLTHRAKEFICDFDGGKFVYNPHGVFKTRRYIATKVIG
jgi:hypothetical protein